MQVLLFTVSGYIERDLSPQAEGAGQTVEELDLSGNRVA